MRASHPIQCFNSKWFFCQLWIMRRRRRRKFYPVCSARGAPSIQRATVVGLWSRAPEEMLSPGTRFMRHLPDGSFLRSGLPGCSGRRDTGTSATSDQIDRTRARTPSYGSAGGRPGQPCAGPTDRPATGRRARPSRRTPDARREGDSAVARAVRPCVTLRARASRKSHATTTERGRGDARPHACTWAGLAARPGAYLSVPNQHAGRPAGWRSDPIRSDPDVHHHMIGSIAAAR
jgi:hypothetical protein